MGDIPMIRWIHSEQERKIMTSLNFRPVPYSPEQYARTVGLWEQLLASHNVSLSELVNYGGSAAPRYLSRVDSECLYSLVLSNGEETDDYYPVEITLVSYSDGGGTALDAANVRALDGYHGVSTTTYGCYGAGEATMVLGELPGDDNEDIDERIGYLYKVVDVIGGLSDYPLIDENELTVYEGELAEEAWDSWLRSDVMGELEEMNPVRDEDGYPLELDRSMAITPEAFQDLEDEVRDLYYSYEGNEWNADTATSVVNGAHKEAVLHVAETLFGWTEDAITEAQETRESAERVRELRFYEWDSQYDGEIAAVWLEYLDAYPLDWFERYSTHTLRVLHNSLRDQDIVPTVESIRQEIIKQSEFVAHRENEGH